MVYVLFLIIGLKLELGWGFTALCVTGIIAQMIKVVIGFFRVATAGDPY